MLHTNENYDEFFALQKANEDNLAAFCEFLDMAMCKQCWLNEYHNHSMYRPFHVHGGVLELLGDLKVTDDEIDRWSKDLEHGFLHGFMVLFFAYCLHPDKNALWDSVFCFNEHSARPERLTDGDRLIVSCLLHDFMRIRGTEPHDEALAELSDKLDPCVYSHSNPSLQNHPLIGADRLELLRYDDHKEWCDFNLIQPYIEQYGGVNLIDHFFMHIRPVLSKMFEHKDDVWVAHLLERTWVTVVPIDDNKNVDFYPKSHWCAIDPAYEHNANENSTRYISVNVGKLPYGGCLSHLPVNDAAVGLISLPSLRSSGCRLLPSPNSTCGRDHPFLFEDKKVPIKNWLFVYNHIDHMKRFDKKDIQFLSTNLFNKIYSIMQNWLVKFKSLSVT